MTDKPKYALPEWEFAAKFLAASVAGFGTDAGLLHIATAMDVAPEWGRIASLLCAMQVVFVINLALMRGQVDQSRPAVLWARYMATQAVGNFCNYGLFVFLVSTDWPFISENLTALTAGAVFGWFVNYAGARFVVFANRRKPRSA